MYTKAVLIGVLLVSVPLVALAQEKAPPPKADAASAPSARAADGGQTVIHKFMTWERFSMVFVIALLTIIVALLIMLRSDLDRYVRTTGTPPGGRL